MSTRRRHASLRALAAFLPLMGVLVLLSTAEAIMRHGLAVAVIIVVLPPAAFLFGRCQARRTAARPRRPLGGPSPSAELAQLRDENSKLRTKVRVLSELLNGPEARS